MAKGVELTPIAHPITQAAPTVTSTHPHNHARRYCECDAATPTAGAEGCDHPPFTCDEICLDELPISCGNHKAASCAACPFTSCPRSTATDAAGCGASWCNGNCLWDGAAAACVDWDETLAQALQGISDADGGDTPPPPTSPQLWAIAYATAPPPPPSSSQVQPPGFAPPPLPPLSPGEGLAAGADQATETEESHDGWIFGGVMALCAALACSGAAAYFMRSRSTARQQQQLATSTVSVPMSTSQPKVPSFTDMAPTATNTDRL